MFPRKLSGDPCCLSEGKLLLRCLMFLGGIKMSHVDTSYKDHNAEHLSKKTKLQTITNVHRVAILSAL